MGNLLVKLMESSILIRTDDIDKYSTSAVCADMLIFALGHTL